MSRRGSGRKGAFFTEIVFKTIPEADAVIFLMDIQQPLKRSEADFLRNRILGTRIVKTMFVLNDVDSVSI